MGIYEFTKQAEIFATRNPKVQFIFSAVFDDTRQSVIRESLLPTKLSETTSKLLRQRTEDIIVQRLENYLGVTTLLQALEGKILTSLYELRNTIFGITATTLRPKNEKAYNSNLLCFESFIKTFADHQVVIYIAPIRNDVPIPYNLVHYNDFKSDIKKISREYSNVAYFNLENLVDNSMWGAKDATIYLNSQK